MTLIKLPEDGECIISQQEMMDCPYSSQQALKLLMEKGAPIIGCCVLCMDARYHWFCEDNPSDLTTKYSWKVKES